MNTVQRIARNTTIFLISQIGNYIISFFTLIYIARYLGAEGFGILSLALALSGIFVILTDLGLNTLTTREVARNKSLANKYIFNNVLIKVLLGFLTVLLITLTTKIINYPQDVINVIYIITLSLIVGSFSGILYSIFQALEKIEYQSIGQVLNSILLFIGVILAIHYGFEVIGFAIIYLITSIFILAYSVIILIWKFFLPKYDLDLNFWKSTLKEALPFGLTGITGMIYTYIDSVILSIIQGNQVVGWYSAAYTITLVLLFIPNAVNIAIFPLMSRLYDSTDHISLKLIYERYFKYMIIIGIPIGTGTTILANNIVSLIFGPSYIQSVIVLQIIVWGIVFTFAGAAFIKLFESINKQMIITKLSATCMILNIILNLALIPKFSYIGASISTLITEIILVSSIFWVSYKIDYKISKIKILAILSKVIFASLIMGIFILCFKNLNLIVLIVLAALLYLITLYAIKGIDKEDIYLLKEVVR